ncbi:hypothetical protein BH20VER1_BH20VER1_20800 [soil metagenome]
MIIETASPFDIEAIRFSRELTFADELAARVFGSHAQPQECPPADRVRRRLLSSHVRLTQNMAPEVFDYAQLAAAALGISKPVEIYQGAGEENAANWSCADTVFISLQGSMMSLLDRESFIALLGHEMGHHLAHTDSFIGTARQTAMNCAVGIAYDPRAPGSTRALASRLAMAREFTADRFAAVAAGGLDGPVRLMMSIVTGLPAERLKADSDAYLAQARALFEPGDERESKEVGSHPEHLLRVYALWLFIESDAFQPLTGQGCGTRTLADVDAELERLLTGAGERVFEAEKDTALAPDVQEFGLCAAVLMATADGTLDDSESKILEETFSAALPNWKELLLQEKARARFGELLPLAVTGGEQVASSVFNLLVHVMRADQEVHVRELEMLAAVGRSLQQEYLFNYLLAAVTRELHLARSDAPVERPLPPLPPGRHEALAALAALFAGISRRGGGTVSLSRLLRIIGKPAWEPQLLASLEKAMGPHHLVMAAPPVAEQDGSVRAEQPLLFRLDDTETARRAAAAAIEPGEFANARTRDGLLVALRHLRERLVSGDGRSPSVRLYRASSGRHFDLAQLDRVITARSERVATLLDEDNAIPLLAGEEAGLHRTASEIARTLRALEREFKARVEETGSRDFFAGHPFLVGNVQGFFIRAPLMLHPFSLAGDPRGAGAFSLVRREGDTAVANQALLRLVFAKKGYAFTEELANELDTKAGESCEALLEMLRRIGLDLQPLSGAIVPFEEMNAAATTLLAEGLAISENAVIGFFPQSSSDLLQDYDELIEQLELHGDSVCEAFNAACSLLPAAYRPAFQASGNGAHPHQPVIHADPSQRQAVIRSRATRLMVLDGPPGTGKSQTIVNLVADALSRGERVAVVCEKRVALDVVKQRLDGAGIGHLAAVVHDVYDDRKPLYRHIADRLELTEQRIFEDTEFANARSEAAEIEGQLAMGAKLLAVPTGAELNLGQLHTMAAAFDTPVLPLPSLSAVKRHDLPRLAQHAIELQPFARLFAVESPFRARAGLPKRALLVDSDMTAIERDLASTREVATACAEAYARLPLAPEALEAAEGALQTASGFAEAAESAVAPELAGRMLGLRSQDPARAGDIEEWFAQVEKYRAAAEAERARVQIENAPDLTGTLAIARRHCRSFLRFFNSQWRAAKREIDAFVFRNLPEKAGAKIDEALLAAIEQRLHATHAWAAAEEIYRSFQIQSLLPRDAPELFRQLPAKLSLWHVSGRLALGREALETLGYWPTGDGAAVPTGGWKAWSKRCREALELLALQRAWFDAALQLAKTFPQALELDAAGVQNLAGAFATERNALRSADRILRQVETFFGDAAELAQTLADLLPDGSPPAWSDAVRRGWAEAHIAAAEAADPSLVMLDQPPPFDSIEKASARLIELHQRMAHEESLRLAALGDRAGLMAVASAAARARRTPEQALRENLVRECRKQRNVLPMRTLVRRTAMAGLLDVVPVWLMSPETTAILFPREPVFDLLIVDEASQCTVENGLPVLTRARRAVIAGDDKQMPPSSFFKTASTLQIDVDEEAEVPPDSLESESLLVLARTGNTGAPLRWHYRALFEELIAFSNYSMYGGSLLTIPSTHSRSAPPALQWVRITDGVWDAGTNAPEARRVVDVLGELLARPQPPSIGIVTFNLPQRRTILDEIDARRAADAEFGRLFDSAASAESLDARPFVKNLEAVQGDERDVIIFSLGYAPVPRKRRDGSDELYVPARFGPLGQKGGERRLNVAVSRAKQAIVVVSSFDPSMLSVAHTRHDGPRMFKAFVEFARHLGEGRRSQAEKVLSLVNDVAQRTTVAATAAQGASALFLPLHHQIALRLEAAGLRVETLVGSSEFRLPVAVVHGAESQQYSLAILCDDGACEVDVYEQFVHIPNVLTQRKWRYLRVSARDWHLRRDQTLERIRACARNS